MEAALAVVEGYGAVVRAAAVKSAPLKAEPLPALSASVREGLTVREWLRVEPVCGVDVPLVVVDA
jgi:hypothetical protein